jgi:hypothetical protein
VYRARDLLVSNHWILLQTVSPLSIYRCVKSPLDASFQTDAAQAPGTLVAGMIIGKVLVHKRLWQRNHMNFPAADSGSSQLDTGWAQETSQ